MARQRIGQHLIPSEPTDPYFEEYAGFGMEEVRPDDISWRGDYGDYNQDPYLKQLESEDILPNVFAHIVDMNPSEVEPSPKGRTSQEDRVETIMAALHGYRRKKGRPEKKNIGVLLDVARKYFEARYFMPDQKHLDTIIWEVLVEWGVDPSLDEDARGNAIRPIRTAFNKDKDRLITRITSDGQDALRTRDAKVQEVLDVLRKVGALGSKPER